MKHKKKRKKRNTLKTFGKPSRIRQRRNLSLTGFTKMVASGNDFIVLKGISPQKKLIQDLCKRHTGIGADGILLMEPSKKADFRMRIFNPDGSEPEMCGNGARCISLYAWKNKFIPKKFLIETLAGILKAEIIPPNKVTIYLSKPKNIKLNLKYKNLKIHSINTGVPHVIIYVPDVNKVDVLKLGRAIRWHKQFQPQGTNVDFVQVLNKNHIAVRTYERGVENETLACGTGVTASAIISNKIRKLNSAIKINTKSGDILEVNTKKSSLTGPAHFVFKGGVI